VEANHELVWLQSRNNRQWLQNQIGGFNHTDWFPAISTPMSVLAKQRSQMAKGHGLAPRRRLGVRLDGSNWLHTQSQSQPGQVQDCAQESFVPRILAYAFSSATEGLLSFL
jgi:hypothetical protein